MTFSIGLDIGGTKIAGAVFDEKGLLLGQNQKPTPTIYADVLNTCTSLIEELDKICGAKATVGIASTGMIDREKGSLLAPNIPCMQDQAFRTDCENRVNRKVQLANDADCAALAEATDGAGQGYRGVFGLILGTGVGGSFVIDGALHQGPHGLAGEIGHLPLPYREPSDGPIVPCGCGQQGCIDKSLSGPALARLYQAMTGREIKDASHVVTSLQKSDAETARVRDQYYTSLAKGMVTIIHAFDPDIIVVNGGLITLKGLYDEVPKRLASYVLGKRLRSKIVPAKHGALSGLRGAARLGQMS